MDIVTSGFPSRMDPKNVHTLKMTVRRAALEVTKRHQLDEGVHCIVNQEMACVAPTGGAVIGKRIFVAIFIGRSVTGLVRQELATDIKEAVEGRFQSFAVGCRVILSAEEA